MSKKLSHGVIITDKTITLRANTAMALAIGGWDCMVNVMLAFMCGAHLHRTGGRAIRVCTMLWASLIRCWIHRGQEDQDGYYAQKCHLFFNFGA